MHPNNIVFDDDGDNLCNHVVSSGFDVKEASLVCHFRHIRKD